MDNYLLPDCLTTQFPNFGEAAMENFGEMKLKISLGLRFFPKISSLRKFRAFADIYPHCGKLRIFI